MGFGIAAAEQQRRRHQQQHHRTRSSRNSSSSSSSSSSSTRSRSSTNTRSISSKSNAGKREWTLPDERWLWRRQTPEVPGMAGVVMPTCPWLRLPLLLPHARRKQRASEQGVGSRAQDAMRRGQHRNMSTLCSTTSWRATHLLDRTPAPTAHLLECQGMETKWGWRPARDSPRGKF